MQDTNFRYTGKKRLENLVGIAIGAGAISIGAIYDWGIADDLLMIAGGGTMAGNIMSAIARYKLCRKYE